VSEFRPGPLRFREILKEKVWGGDRLRGVAGKPISSGARIGESWEVSDRDGDVSVVAEGPLAGTTLRELVERHRAEVVGPDAALERERFPLLVKLIDANDLLSVQVHPDDDYARRRGSSDPGKTEAWHILHADPGARLINGLVPGTTRERLRALLDAQGLRECLHEFAVSAGDTLFCPPGTVHALGAGIVLIEVQQNSDTTYRMYDWGRLGLDGNPRELHLDDALQVIRFDRRLPDKQEPKPIRGLPFAAEELVRCDKFVMQLWHLAGPARVERRAEAFEIICVVNGEGAVAPSDRPDIPVALHRGATVLLPASLHSYVIRAEAPLDLLCARAP